MSDFLKSVISGVKSVTDGSAADVISGTIHGALKNVLLPALKFISRLFGLDGLPEKIKNGAASLQEKAAALLNKILQAVLSPIKNAVAVVGPMLGFGEKAKVLPRNASHGERKVSVWVTENDTVMFNASPTKSWKELDDDCKDKLKEEYNKVLAALKEFPKDPQAKDIAATIPTGTSSKPARSAGTGLSKTKKEKYKNLVAAVDKLAKAYAERCDDTTFNPCKYLTNKQETSAAGAAGSFNVQVQFGKKKDGSAYTYKSANLRARGKFSESQVVCRVHSVKGIIKGSKKSERENVAQLVWKKLMKQIGVDGQDGGHLVSLEFGGPDDLTAIVPQEENLNRNGPWWFMERRISRCLKQPGVDLLNYTVNVKYESSPGVIPSGFEVILRFSGAAAGERNVFFIPNRMGEVRYAGSKCFETWNE